MYTVCGNFFGGAGVCVPVWVSTWDSLGHTSDDCLAGKKDMSEK